MRKLLTCLAATGLLCAVVTGCSDGDHQSSDGGGQTVPPQTGVGIDRVVLSDRVEKDIKTWALPTDPYFGTSDYFRLRSYAVSLVKEDCMKAQGVDIPEPLFDPSAPRRETDANSYVRVLFSEELAKKYGYRQAPQMSAPAIVRERGYLWEPGSVEEEISRNCLDQQVRKRVDGQQFYPSDGGSTDLHEPLPDEGGNDAQSVTSQMNRLAVNPATDAQLLAAGQKWRECMAPMGISDLPQFPWQPGGFPPDSLLSRFGDWHTTGQPSADEVSVATFDAQCRQSSGWFETLYDKQWNLEEEFVNLHRDELAPILEEKQQDLDRYVKIINEYLSK